MQPEQRDAAYLWDMWVATRSVCEITTGVTLAEYLQNRLMYRAVERELEIIGEGCPPPVPGVSGSSSGNPLAEDCRPTQRARA
jgi:hypothetical protein